MIDKIKILLFIFLTFLSLGGCTPKITAVSTVQEDEYYEDLSGLRPEGGGYSRPSVEDKNPHTDTKEPAYDITDELNILLDSITRINRETEYMVYTIMVHNSNSRESAEMAMKLVFQAQIQIRPKLEYVPPSYKVKVGQFFTQLEAFPILEQLRKDFPNAVIVPERIFLR